MVVGGQKTMASFGERPVTSAPVFSKDIEPQQDGSALSVLSILDRQDSIRQYAGPGHWNDPDMLEVGERDDRYCRR